MDFFCAQPEPTNTSIDDASAMPLHTEMYIPVREAISDENTIVIGAETQCTEMQRNDEEPHTGAFSDDHVAGDEASDHECTDCEFENDDIDNEMETSDVVDQQADKEELRNRVHDYDATNIDFHYDGGYFTFNQFYNLELERLQLIDALTDYDGYVIFRFCHSLANGVIRDDLLSQLSRPVFSDSLAQRAKEVYWEEFAQHFFEI